MFDYHEPLTTEVPMDQSTLKSYAIGLLSCILLVIGVDYLKTGKPYPPAPYVVQPSVPSLIPPPLSCACGTTKQIIQPFNVSCPYCRNTISISPSAAGSLIGKATLTPATTALPKPTVR